MVPARTHAATGTSPRAQQCRQSNARQSPLRYAAGLRARACCVPRDSLCTAHRGEPEPQSDTKLVC